MHDRLMDPILQTAFDSIGDAVVIADLKGVVIHLNTVAADLTGWKREEAIGQQLSDVLDVTAGSTDPAVETSLQTALSTAQSLRVYHSACRFPRGGPERDIELHVSPVRSETGQVTGSVLVLRDITERGRIEASADERNRLIALRAEISASLASSSPMGEVLQQCCDALVRHLDMAFARIWTLNSSDTVLHLQASGGLYTHINGPHARVPVGEFKIGRIADSRRPHLTNAVPDDPNVSDREWARKEGMVAFAGYPMTVEDRVLGVVAMFARFPLSEGILSDLAPIADGIAQFIDRRRTEEEVRDQARLYQVTLASIGDAVMTTDANGRVTFLNDVAEELTGWPLDDAKGKPAEVVFNIVNEQTGSRTESLVSKVLKDGKVVGLANHTILIARDGTRRPIDDSGAPIRVGEEEVRGVVLVFRDISERRREEEERERLVKEIKAANDRMSELFRQAPAFMCVLRGPDHVFDQVNDEYVRIVKGHEVLGLPVRQALPEMVDQGFVAMLDRVYETGEAFKGMNTRVVLGLYADQPREERFVDFVVLPIRDGDGVVSGLFVHGVDLTERNRAEHDVRQSETLLRLLVDTIPQLAWMARPDGHIFWYNRRWYEYTGTAPEQMEGWGWQSVHDPNVLPEVLQRWQDSIANGVPFDMVFPLLGADGLFRPFLTRVNPLRDSAGEILYWFGTNTDISEQRRAEETSRFLAEVSAALAEVVDVESTLGNVARLSIPYFADWCTVDLVTDDGDLKRLAVAHIEPSRVQLAEEMYHRYPPRPDDPYGPHHVLRTGEAEMAQAIDDAMIATVAQDSEHLRLLKQLNLTSYISVPLTVRSKVRGVITFITSTHHAPYGPDDLNVARDLTHRAAIAIDNAELYHRLKETDRRKDEFLAILAHELRNPLAPIRNGLQILRIAENDGKAVEKVCSMMDRQLTQLVRLVDDLLDISRVTRNTLELRKERLKLSDVLDSAVETSRPLIEAGEHSLEVKIPETPIYLDADFTRLAQIFSNLLNNAAKFTDRGGQISLSAEMENGRAVVRVRDNGIGLSADDIRSIFDLFVQADTPHGRTGGGLGIGLTLVQRLVQMHDGDVQVKSAGKGQGSEFIVRLRVPDDTLLSPRQASPRIGSLARVRRVLVVDDNRDAAQSLAELLTVMGNETFTAFDGGEALTAAETIHPDVVLLDIGLPVLSGYEVARKLRETSWGRDLLLVAVTGWGQEADRKKTREAGFNGHLVKPIEIDLLTRLLDDLDEAHTR